ncbi:flavin reductase family protein [Streptomyces sp. NBC_01754]|uniref:NADH-dependent FAD reductase SgcE6 n=1 Tax=Streptomyces sp. NBC_01754 TaxID=2975930 RepID=UPI002DDB3149|nr:flavin reductase family protein [Streptomyces sp. NBC_01754]WSC90960.1 flavin reductase family protein [Streptomyces sp. NBC_01754]WSC96546.1 flavin reductase family protein [Streptomyces sp. NBC_01754]
MSPIAAPSAEPVDLNDRARLRSTFAAFPTGVTVVTAGGDEPRGMTANSFTSVSLSPPLVLVCVTKDAVMHRCLTASSAFAVSVLATGQQDVARHFADRSRPAGAGQFDAVGPLPGKETDAPLIAGAAAHLECRKWRVYDGGDHTIFLGEVLTATHWPARESLLFSGGRFRSFAPDPGESRAA